MPYRALLATLAFSMLLTGCCGWWGPHGGSHGGGHDGPGGRGPGFSQGPHNHP
jgi:hypothetical protein